MAQNYGLGRGLSSLIPQKKIKKEKDDKKTEVVGGGGFVAKRERDNLSDDRALAETFAPAENESGKVLEVDIDKVVANPHQPRLKFDEEKLQELAQSIKEHGIIQPLIVTEKDGRYELIAGERRLQASKLANLKKVPVIVKKIQDKEKLELAIIENIQRHDLNPIEEAKAYKKLMDDFEMSQEDVAKKMGKSRSVVANKLRLLKLPIEAVRALSEEKISEGHAKAILALKNPEKQRALLDLIIKKRLTVRQAEDKTKEVTVQSHKRKVKVDPEVKELEEKFALALGTKVKIKKSGGEGGRIVIEYYSEEELDKIVDKLS